jgi:hypothetical protein
MNTHFAVFLGVLSSLYFDLSHHIFSISSSVDVRAEWLAWAWLFGSTRLYLWYKTERSTGTEPDITRQLTTNLSLNTLTVSIVVASILQRTIHVSWMLVRKTSSFYCIETLILG